MLQGIELKLIDRILSRIAPYECIFCGDEGRLLCARCTPKLGRYYYSACFRCLSPTENFRTCDDCRKIIPLNRVWWSYAYDGPVKSLVRAFKFDGKRAAAKDLARLLQPVVAEFPDAVLVHIPTATTRIRERGYDHARLLAAALAARTAQFHLALLSRTSQVRQVGSSRHTRIKNIAGAFRLTKNESLKGVHIILVDDVITTGATLAEAARTLRRAGASRVDAVVLARTPM